MGKGGTEPAGATSRSPFAPGSSELSRGVDGVAARGDREVAPTEVAPTEVAPMEGAPTGVAPTEVGPTEVAPAEGAPTERAAARIPFALAPVTVVVGHYGVGKTNFALNLALDAAAEGCAVTLADMDVVNPYFRSSEYAALLEDHGVRLVAPVFARAGTGLDVPSLTGAVVPAVQAAYAWAEKHGTASGRRAQAMPLASGEAEPLGRQGRGPCPTGADATCETLSGEEKHPVVIIDAGGDDVGATALARFAPAIEAGPHEVLYVANAFRNLTPDAASAVAVLREIEAKSHLAVTAVAANSHLQGETTLGHILESVPFARETAARAAVPLRCITVPMSAIQREKDGAAALAAVPESYPVQVLVSVPWGRAPYGG